VGELVSLEARDLACVRGGRTVFERLSFSVGGGGALVLEGPNGSGKTSALRIVAGLLLEAAGAIVVRSQHGTISGREERGPLCALLGHDDGVKAHLTVNENARFAATLYRRAADTAAALDRVGLSRVGDAPAQYLSAGQRRRLALARLLLCGRPLWLLDEPLAALDADGRRLVSSLIQQHCAGGGVTIAATHEHIGIDAPRVSLDAA
jgi:heme exporter protein A